MMCTLIKSTIYTVVHWVSFRKTEIFACTCSLLLSFFFGKVGTKITDWPTLSDRLRTTVKIALVFVLSTK